MAITGIAMKEETPNQWQFVVEIEDVKKPFHVTVTKPYYRQLTDESEPAQKLVRESFRFLLEREPAGSILHTFDLKEIETYFPEYVRFMQEQFKANQPQ